MSHRKLILNRAAPPFLLIAPILSTAQTRLASASQKPLHVILGVLEDIPGVYAGDPDTRRVRAVFQKVGDTWQAFPTKTESYLDLRSLPASYPTEVKWTIAFHGKSLGTVTARTPAKFDFYSWIGTEIITSHNPIPTIGKKSTDYSGFLDTPVYRPLVAISLPNVSDPDHWHRITPAPSQIKSVRQQFRSRFPSVSNCANPDEDIAKPWHYRNSDIHILDAYASRQHLSLIHLSLTGYDCDGPPDLPFLDQWFLFQQSGKALLIGKEMRFLDAGDYDSSGHSELLFLISGENTGGYRLFYRNFTRSAQFVFNYH